MRRSTSGTSGSRDARKRRRAWLSITALLLPAVLIGLAAPAQAHSFYLYAPWRTGTKMAVAGCGGSYYDPGTHNGVDINDDTCASDCGVGVYSAHKGTVIKKVLNPNNGATQGYGTYVVLRYGRDAVDGATYDTYYAHLEYNSVTVAVGDVVTNGVLLGRIGNTGHSTGCHLHFELRKDGGAHFPSPMSGKALYKGIIITSDNVPPDTTAPKVDITSPAANAWVRGVVTVTATSSDASGVAKVGLSIDGDAYRYDTAPPYAWSWDTRAEPNGGHTLKALSVDKTGNTATDSSVSRVDNAPPTTTASASGTAGLNGWWRSAVSVSLSASDAHSGVQATYRSVDGGSFAAGTTATVSGDGIHTVRYYSTDKVGNTEPVKNVVIRIDATPPAVAITDPVPGHAYVSDMDLPAEDLPETLIVGPKTLDADASDAMSGVDRVEFWVDSTKRASTANPYAWVWSADDEALGDHAIEARAFDRAGNSARTSMGVKTVPASPEGLCATLGKQLPPADPPDPVAPLPACPPTLPPLPGA